MTSEGQSRSVSQVSVTALERIATRGQVWARVSEKWPTRGDGKPNRPLTAFSVEIAPCE